LAEVGALEPLTGHRHSARWAAAGAQRLDGVLRESRVQEAMMELPSPTEGENLRADYRSLKLTLGRHPLALLRDRLHGMGFATAAEVRAARHGQALRTSGIVIGRQRPDTASGVVFVTLEDETGCVNVIVWRDLGDRQRRELLGARLLAVHGVIEREGDVVHVVARRLTDHSALLGALVTRSRDFH
jgi:error-prone DNA polymerase